MVEEGSGKQPVTFLFLLLFFSSLLVAPALARFLRHGNESSASLLLDYLFVEIVGSIFKQRQKRSLLGTAAVSDPTLRDVALYRSIRNS